MNDPLINKLKGKVILKVEGKNLERFIRRLYQHKIDILNIKYPNPKTVIITIFEKDYEKVIEIKTVYEIDLVGSAGSLKIKKKLKLNRFFIVGLVLGICLLYFLSHIIFQIEIIHTDKEIRTLLTKELETHGIKVFNLKKSFDEIEKIKEDIINRNKDKIEWLEIEAVGTKYVVRVEERKIEEIKKEGENRNVVASKSAVLRRVDAEKGEIIRDKGDYVKAGDVVISGELKLNDELKENVSAEGTIYGEVWYKVIVSYPFVYKEEIPTGKSQTAYTLRVLNKEFQLYPWNYYKTKNIEENKLLYHSFLPISFSKEKQFEKKVVDEVNTEDESISNASALERQKMEEKLSSNESIISQKNLKVELKESKIELEIFFTVLEDITSYQNIIVEENIESE